MNKSLGGAAKARERKKIKLEQVAHNCSQNISSMFNAIAKKSSKLEPVEPQVILINYNRTIEHLSNLIDIIVTHRE